MKYLIIKTSLLDPSAFLSAEASGDERFIYEEIFTLLNFSCIRITEELFSIYKQIWNGKYIEVESSIAEKGSIHFSEVRDFGKELITGGSTGPYATKVEIKMTPELKEKVVSFMKLFAKEVIEDEYTKRYFALKNTSDLESASWEIQKHEAREWLTYQGSDDHKTPFLDYLSLEREIDKTDLANKILKKSELYEDTLSTLLVEMQKLLKQFKNATSIWDLNILYEDHFNIMMPQTQAITLGRTVSETDWTRLSEVKANGFNF